MVIKGLSDISRIPRIGKIRLGIKEKSASGYDRPKAVDYFVFDPDDESIVPTITKIYGDKPKAIDVVFVSNNPEEVFPQHLKRYTKSAGLVCRGDGESATEMLFEKKEQGGRTVYERVGEKQVPCKCHYYEEDACKPMAHLMFMLYNVPGIGVWQLDTGSFNSIININSKLKILQSLYGKIANIPVRLILKPITVTPEKTATPKIVYVLDIAIDKTPKQIMDASEPKTLDTQKLKQLEGKPVVAPDESDSTYHYPEVHAAGEPTVVNVAKDMPIATAEEVAVDDTASEAERQAFKGEVGERGNDDVYIAKINAIRAQLGWTGKDIQDLAMEEFGKMPRAMSDDECEKLIVALTEALEATK